VAASSGRFSTRSRSAPGIGRPAHRRRPADRQHDRARLDRGRLDLHRRPAEREAGLSRAILSITLFTFYFTSQMLTRPFEESSGEPRAKILLGVLV
jgi:hypothetical protein